MKKSWLFGMLAVICFFVSALSLCIHALSLPVPVFAETSSGMKIVLDAGHGGIDGGVTGVKTGVKESDLNLQIAFVLKSALEDMGFEVIMTRKTAAGLYGVPTKGFKRRDMQARKETIESADPDIVLSIHQNRYPSQSARGAQIFHDGKNQESRRLAESLQLSLNGLYKKQGAKERSIMQGEYFILGCAPVPSVIVECGFLSNAADEALLVTPAWQNELARSMIQGLMHYFSQSSL